MSHPLSTPLGRFGIVTSVEGADLSVATIPAGGMVNPLTGGPTLAPLAMLVDHTGGLVNHYRRRPGEWTVSSELSLELAPDAATRIASAPDVPVLAAARAFGSRSTTSLALCELTHRDAVIGTATVRSFHITAPDQLAHWPDGPSGPPPPATLAQRMAVEVGESGGQSQVLVQLSDPVLNNSMGVVHGGVSAMALELVGSAAINAGRDESPLRTASLRLNYLRPFHSGRDSRYVGTHLHLGRSSGVAETRAIGTAGKVAITARLTAYR